MDAREATQLVLEAGKSEELKAAFLAVAEVTTPMGELKYPPKVCRDLAKAIACRSYAKSVLQLCHLVNVADACGRGRESYERFFFGGQRATSRNFRAFINEALASRGWRRAGFECTAEGVAIRYSDGVFNVAFPRMPVLTALFEFLIGIENYREVDEILGRMLCDAHDQAAVGTAAKALSRRIYGYLAQHLPSAQNAAKFRHILEFLKGRASDRTVRIDDHTILRFWFDHAVKEDGRASDFRAFRTVLEAFVAFSRALELAADQTAIQRAATVGSDLEASEVDPDDLSSLADLPGEWESPLPLLTEEPVNRVKFLTNREKESLRLLLELGPMSQHLPLSLLRAEVFGRLQARITQALRAKSDERSLHDLIECADAESYGSRQAVYVDLHGQTQRVMQAALHVLLRDQRMTGSGNVSAMRPDDPIAVFEQLGETPEPHDPEELDLALREAGKAFREFSRKGFAERETEDPTIIEGFRHGAGVLLTIAQEIDRILNTLKRIDQDDPDLAGWFQRDGEIFRIQFRRLYGAAI
jgi:CRISPR/Cas system CSM-associated protein Csm2 small subunit